MSLFNLKNFLPTIIAFVLFVLVITLLNEDRNLHFENELEVESIALVNSFNESVKINIEYLSSLKRYMISSEFVNRAEFRQFVSPLVSNAPELSALGWIPEVPHNQRTEFVNAARIDGIEGFEFKRWSAQLGWNTQLEDWARMYYPVFYIEPIDTNSKALGIDLGSHKKRRVAIDKALSSLEVSPTEVVDLAQGGKGVLVYLSLSIEHDEEPINNLQTNGLVSSVIKVRDFFDRSYSLMAENYIIVRVYESADKERLIYSSQDIVADISGQFHRFEFMGSEWLIETIAGEKFYKQHSENSIWYALLLGLLFVAVVAIYNYRNLLDQSLIMEKIVSGSKELARHSQMLERSEAHQRAIIEIMQEAVITINEKGIIEEFNNAAVSMFGYSAPEAIGENVKIIMPSTTSASHDGYLQQYSKTGIKHIIDSSRPVIGQRKNGETFALELKVTEQQFNGKRFFIGVLYDQTPKEKLLAKQEIAKKQLDIANAELERANKDLEQFAYVASHDLKAPLRAISNLADWISEDLGDGLEGENLKNMDLLKSRVERLDSLLTDLLEYSRSGRSDREEIEFDSFKMVKDLVDLHGDTKDVKINVSGELPIITTNRAAFELILRNLIGNAIKHHQGVLGQIDISVDLDDEQVIFQVSDDGDGVAKENQEKIFDMFTSIKTTDHGTGSGMGLAICRRAAESIGGRVWLDGQYSAGARFCLSIPCNAS